MRINQLKSIPTITKNNWAYDAFGKLRISQPETIFDSKLLHDAAPLFWDDQEVSGGSTGSTYNTNQASVTLDVANTTAGKRVRQTFMRFNYQPGKSQLIMMTGVINDPVSGITVEAGPVDDENGFFFYTDGTDVGVCLRSYATGSAVDTKIPQSSWSLDILDGSGTSGVTADWTKTQIFFVDFEWLGVGSVRFGVIVDGIPIYVHEQHHANSIAVVYASTPSLPLRWAIENDGTGVAADVTQICSTVIAEGGSQPTGAIFYESTDGTAVTCSTTATEYAVIGIKLKSTHLDGIVEIVSTSLQIQSATKSIEWRLVLNPTVAGTFTYSAVTNASVEVATGATANTVSGGYKILGGFLESGNNNSGLGSGPINALENAIRVGAAIDGTVDELVLTVTPNNGSSAVDVEGMITWRELN